MRHKNVIFHPFARSLQMMDLYQIWFRAPPADVINCVEFCYQRLRGFAVWSPNSRIDLACYRQVQHGAGATAKPVIEGIIN